MRRRTGVIAAALSGLSVLAAPAPAVAAAEPADGVRSVLLATGDRVDVHGPRGQETAVLRPRAGSADAFVTQRDADGGLYVIPASAPPGLDRSLFTVTAPGHGDSPPVAATHPLRLTVLDETGGPNNGTVAVTNLDDKTSYTRFVSTVDGAASVDVPGGHYEAAAFVPDFTGGKWWVRTVIKNFTVTAGTSVTLDARTATVPAGSTTPRPAELVGNSVHYQAADAKGATGVAFNFHSQQPAEFLFNPAPAAEVGNRHIAVGEHKRSPAGAAEPYTYDLKFRADGALGDNLRHTYRPADLAALRVGYHGDVAHQTGVARVSRFAHESAGAAFFRYFDTPVRRTEYVVGSPGLWYQDNVIANRMGDGRHIGYAQTYRPGTTVPRDYFHGPMVPGIAEPAPDNSSWICAGCRQGDSMRFHLAPLLDPDGKVYFWDSPSGGTTTSARLRLLTADGTSLLDVTGFYGGQATVPAARGRYRAVMELRRSGPWFHHSTASRTEWTFTSGHSAEQTVPDNWRCSDDTPAACSALPLLTVAPRLDTALDGTMPVGPARLTVAFGPAPGAPEQAVTQAAVEVSFDDGATWQKTALVPLGDGRYRAHWFNPRSAARQDVAVRTSATDAAGNSVTQTVTAAYTVGK
ncbi:hypothetical protein [Amycolatopsis suaedae]|uniref:Serine protease n=1 Tax=Amycolatopsis suaedae TaxID=2510978 RepID=A0A4Q7J4M1_9PSEU|nr:hypothetical protein [Amycolatopsis suaedae]RZQ60954.1 hypothetical protein EWH70_26055 [Amycolatopsis suaedae]